MAAIKRAATPGEDAEYFDKGQGTGGSEGLKYYNAISLVSQETNNCACGKV